MRYPDKFPSNCLCHRGTDLSLTNDITASQICGSHCGKTSFLFSQERERSVALSTSTNRARARAEGIRQPGNGIPEHCPLEFILPFQLYFSAAITLSHCPGAIKPCTFATTGAVMTNGSPPGSQPALSHSLHRALSTLLNDFPARSIYPSFSPSLPVARYKYTPLLQATRFKKSSHDFRARRAVRSASLR